MAVELSDILEREDIHAVYVERYRAEYVMKRLWRIAQGLSSWSRLPRGDRMWHERQQGQSGGSGRGELKAAGAAMTEVPIPACHALGLDEHKLYLYAGEVERAMRKLPREQLEALEELLNLRRYSATFWVVKKYAMVRRSPSATRGLERAAMTLAATAEVVE